MKSVFCNAATILSVAVLALSAVSLHAQLPVVVTQVEAEVEDAEIIMQNSPDIEASDVKEKRSPRTRQWLEIEVPFELKSNSRIGIVPEITMKFYIAVRGAGSSGYVLTDSFTYANIPDDETVYSILYVSPSSLARIAGGFDQFDDGDVASWGVELLFNGERIDGASSTGRDWWSSFAGTRINGFLLPKEKTPFSVLWVDRHVELKQQN